MQQMPSEYSALDSRGAVRVSSEGMSVATDAAAESKLLTRGWMLHM